MPSHFRTAVLSVLWSAFLAPSSARIRAHEERWGADNNEGILPEKGTHVLMGQFPGGPPGYFAHMQKCRDEARRQFRLVEAFSPPSWSLTRLCLLDRERRWTRLISSDRACWRVLSKLMKRWQYTESLV